MPPPPRPPMLLLLSDCKVELPLRRRPTSSIKVPSIVISARIYSFSPSSRKVLSISSYSAWSKVMSMECVVVSKSLALLTEREREVLELVGRGLSNQEIAEKFVISPDTAKTHVNRIMSKIYAHDRAQLVILAYESGLLVPGEEFHVERGECISYRSMISRMSGGTSS